MRWRKIALFFGVAFAGTYGTVALFLLLGGSFESATWLELAFVATLFPAISAMLLQRFVYREPLRETLALHVRPNRWWALAWVAGPLICVATLGVSLLVPGVHYDPAMHGVVDRAMATPEQHAQLLKTASSLSLRPFVLLVVPSVVLAPTVGMISAAGEEIGWRGLLYQETLSLGFLRQSLVVGLVWWLWHAPLVFMGYQGYRGHPIAGSAALFCVLMLSTPLYNLVRLRSGSSLAAALFHSACSAGGLIAVGAAVGGSGLSVGYGSFSCAVVFVFIDIALAIRLR